MKRNYVVKENGVIKGGTASYDVDSNGLITYECHVQAKILFFTKTVSFSGTYKVDPKILDPSAWNKTGDTARLDNVEFDTTSLNGSIANVSVRVIDKNWTGVGTVDLSVNPVLLLTLQANASVLGLSLVINLVQA